MDKLRKFDSYDDDEDKKDFFEEDFGKEIDDFNYRLEKILDDNVTYKLEDPREILTAYEANFNNALELLQKQAKPFFDEHAGHYKKKIYEFYDEMLEQAYSYWNDFVEDEFPDIKSHFLEEQAELISKVEEEKRLSLIILDEVKSSAEVKQVTFANTCGENKRAVLGVIDNLVEKKILRRYTKSGAYHVAIIDGVEVESVIALLDQKIEAIKLGIAEVKALETAKKTIPKYKRSVKRNIEKETVVTEPKRKLTPEEEKSAVKTMFISIFIGLVAWYFSGILGGILAAIVAFIFLTIKNNKASKKEG